MHSTVNCFYSLSWKHFACSSFCLSLQLWVPHHINVGIWVNCVPSYPEGSCKLFNLPIRFSAQTDWYITSTGGWLGIQMHNVETCPLEHISNLCLKCSNIPNEPLRVNNNNYNVIIIKTKYCMTLSKVLSCIQIHSWMRLHAHRAKLLTIPCLMLFTSTVLSPKQLLLSEYIYLSRHLTDLSCFGPLEKKTHRKRTKHATKIPLNIFMADITTYTSPHRRIS